MRSKDFFTQLVKSGKIDAEDFVKFVDTVPDFEIPDTAFKAFEDKFMTLERAISHPEVSKNLRNQHLNPLDRDIEEMVRWMDQIDKYTAMEVSNHTRKNGDGKEIRDTYKQFSAIKEALPKLFEKAKIAPNDEEIKKQLADAKKVNHELLEKFKSVESEKEERVKSAQKDFEEKLKSYKLDSELEKQSKNYTFADAYEKTRGTLEKAILGDLKAKNFLAYAENNGEPSIEVMNMEDGTPRPKFNGNTPVTLKSLLDEAYKPFLKVSEESGSQRQTTTTYKVDAPPNNTRQGKSTAVI